MKFPVKLRLLVCAALLLLFSLPGAAEDDPQLLYCLLSHESIAQNRFEDFVVDFALKDTGSLRLSLFRDKVDGKALQVWTLKREGGKPTSFNWDGTINGRMIGPGRYILRLASGGGRQDLSFEVTEGGARPPLSLTRPGDYLPAAGDVKSVWQAMQAPLAVADAGELYHEPVYDRPGGRKIGHVHGTTAAVILLELDVDGYAKVGAYATEDGSYITGYMKQERLKMVTPHPEYGLLIDKNTQKLHVFKADAESEDGARLLGSLDVSTGLMARRKLFRETRAGAFFTQKHVPGFSSEGFRYDYAIRIDGGNLIHEIGCKISGGARDYTEQTPQLGTKASHGCVRVQAEKSAEGLSAQWLWQNLPRSTKVLVLDDPGVRMRRLSELGFKTPEIALAQPAMAAEPLTVSAAAGAEAAVPVSDESGPADGASSGAPQEPLPEAAPAAAGRTRLTLTFTGDCIIGSEEKSRKKPESFHGYIEKEGYGWPFSGMLDIFRQDDLTVINLEGVLKEDTRGKQEKRLHWFRGPVDFAKVLPEGSVELAGLANNHARDYGRAGFNSTKQALESVGVPYFGYGETHIHEHQGLKIGFGGIRETIWRQKPNLPGEEIAALREAGCDYIVYTIHGGKEYDRHRNQLQEKMAHAIIDAGADLIVGMHPHVVQGIEQYKQGLILYSLGNFTFGGNLELTEFDGLVAQALLDFEGNTLRNTTLRLIPVLTTGIKPANDFRPIPARGEDKARILSLIQDDSGKLKIEEVMSFAR